MLLPTTTTVASTAASGPSEASTPSIATTAPTVATAASPSPAAITISAVVSRIIAGWWWSAFEFFTQGVVGLSHLRITKMHLSVEVISQSAIIIQSGKIGAANITDLKFLVARWPRGV